MASSSCCLALLPRNMTDAWPCGLSREWHKSRMREMSKVTYSPSLADRALQNAQFLCGGKSKSGFFAQHFSGSEILLDYYRVGCESLSDRTRMNLARQPVLLPLFRNLPASEFSGVQISNVLMYLAREYETLGLFVASHAILARNCAFLCLFCRSPIPVFHPQPSRPFPQRSGPSAL